MQPHTSPAGTMPSSLFADMERNGSGGGGGGGGGGGVETLDDQRALQIALDQLSLLGLDADETGSLYDNEPRKKSVNMTECVPVPSSEHVAEIVGRQGGLARVCVCVCLSACQPRAERGASCSFRAPGCCCRVSPIRSLSKYLSVLSLVWSLDANSARLAPSQPKPPRMPNRVVPPRAPPPPPDSRQRK